MRTRSGLEKAALPVIDLPVRSPPRPTPIARSVPNLRGILKRSAGDNPGAETTPTVSSVTISDARWQALQEAAAMAEPSTAGSISNSAALPPTPPSEPPPTTETITDIDDFTFDDAPKPSSRPHRSLRPTAKVLGTPVVDEMVGGRGERQRPPSPKKKSKNSAGTIAVVKRITGKPVIRDFEAHAASIVEEATRPRAPRAPRASRRVQTEPDILPQPRVFNYSMYRNAYWGHAREPFEAKPCEISTFSYEEWVAKTISYWSGQPTFKGFDLTPDAAIVDLTTHQKGFKTVRLTVAIESDWHIVIEAIDKWKQDGCWTCRIDLKLRITKVQKQPEVTAPRNVPNSPTTPFKIDPDDDELIYIDSRPSKSVPALPAYTAVQQKALTKGTKTEKKLRDEKLLEEIDDINKHYVNRIVKENACPRASCVDNGMPCVQVDDQHVKVLHTELAAWSKQVGQGKATISRPHDSLMETLKLRATKMADKEKAKKKNKNRSSDDSDDSRGRSKSKRRRRRSRSRSPNAFSQVMQALLLTSQLQNSSSAAASRPTAPAHDVPSSPVRVPDRAQLTLQQYMEYLQKLEPAMEARWAGVEEVLDGQDVTFQQLTKLSTAKLENMGLSVGMALRVKDNLKRYISKASRHSSTSSDDSRPRTASR